MAVRFFRSKAAPQPEDSLQISGAIVAPSDGPSPVELVDAGHAPHGLGVVRDQYERKIRKTPTIRMVPSSMMVEGRRLRFAVSDNVDAYGPDGPGSPPIWAVNIHGYFAGGGMYWRESARLAEQLGWRVINPSLPGFGGSDPLDWQDVSMESLANQVMAIVHKVDAGPVVLLGHSMGGAVAVQFAHDHPRRTLGVIYRDGVSTPAWKDRTGVLPTVLSPLLPDVAPMVDMIAAVVFDLPDLFIGRHVLHRARRAARHAPEHPHGGPDHAGRQHAHVASTSAARCATWWPSRSRSSTSGGASTASRPAAPRSEFAAIARSPVLWVPGGHSWMLARPQGQADILTHLVRGEEFMAQVESRWRQLTPASTRCAPSTDAPCRGPVVPRGRTATARARA